MASIRIKPAKTSQGSNSRTGIAGTGNTAADDVAAISTSWDCASRQSAAAKRACQSARPVRGVTKLPTVVILKFHDRAFVLHRSQVERVPVGEADAAVRLGLADLARVGRAVNAVGGRSEIDPDEADRIVWARFDDQWFFGFHALPGELRIVVI